MSTHAPKILFANVPFDENFYPLTGLAKHLADKGYDVRWYSGPIHEQAIAALDIPLFPFKKALELNWQNIDEVFPERRQLKGTMAQLKFTVARFTERMPEHYEDIKEIYGTFPFNIVICDVAFTGASLVKELMGIPVIAVSANALAEWSRELPPPGMGMLPALTWKGRCKHALLRYFAQHFLYKDGLKLLNGIRAKYKLCAYKGALYDVLIKKADLVLQNGIPGFEYKRSDMGANIRFVGLLRPYRLKAPQAFTGQQRLALCSKVILVTQGMGEKDTGKLLVPTLEAFKDSDYFVIAATGGYDTRLLRERFPQKNILIEDFIAFDEVMPMADVYVTDGGYSEVMLSIRHRLPVVAGGWHGGKNETNARVEYFGIGINLGTGAPSPQQVRAGVEEVFSNERYLLNVLRLGKELDGYDAARTTEQYVKALLHMQQRERQTTTAL